MKMAYDRGQVMAAAQFIWDNNPSVHIWPGGILCAMDVMEHILNFSRKQGLENMRQPDSQWVSWGGTGGYMVMFSCDSDDSDTFAIEVYVNANIGENGRYVEEFIDEEQ